MKLLGVPQIALRFKSSSLLSIPRGVSPQTVAQIAINRKNVRWSSTTSTNNVSVEPEKTRNIGIIAHIDAGKTTTTERMLYYSGLTNRIGNVDQGDTVTDFLQAERDRGITITSAAISFFWNGHRINLIDTPGHADFTFEVIRSIRVLDGAITVLDGVAGVEAQTEKVWKQANEMNIPKVVFVNKMDREGAGFGRTVREVVSKLNTRVALVNIPFFAGKDGTDFQGVIDVIDEKLIQWNPNSKDGKDVTVKNIADFSDNENQKIDIKAECAKARTALVETLCDLDEALVEEFLEVGDYMDVSSKSIKASLKRATCNNEVVPVLCGASFRNVGVQPLLEATTQYLPSPIERPPPHAISKLATTNHGAKSGNKNSKKLAKTPTIQTEDVTLDPKTTQVTCALAFKVINDPIRGILVFVRVYSGKLQQGSTVLNTSNGRKEKVSRLLHMQADEAIEVTSVEAGNIAVIMGSKDIRTGDTIVAHITRKDGSHMLSAKDKGLHLHPISIPPPVFFSTIEPLTLSDKRNMDEALDTLLREDPSLHLMYDQDTDQTLISGMGELHLEIAKDRLVNDLKARVEMGQVMVSYKETIQRASEEVEKSITTEDGASSATVKLTVEPVYEDDVEDDLIMSGAENIDVNERKYITYPHEAGNHFQLSVHDICHAIRIGAVPSLARGGKMGNYPLHSLHVKVSTIEIPPEVMSTSAVSTAIRLAADEALDSLARQDYAVMEPTMDVRVIVNEEDIGTVVNDLSGNRRGSIVSLGEEKPSASASEDSNESFFKELAESTYVPPDYTLHLSKHGTRATSQQSVVHARVPLSKMVGYLTPLRSMTQGRGTYLLDFYRYERVSPDRVEDILNS